MKVAIVVPLFSGASGGMKAANTIASQLSETGHEVSILTCEDVKSTFFDVAKNVNVKTIGNIFSNHEYKQDDVIIENREYLFGTIEDRFVLYRQKHKYVEDMLYKDLVRLQPDCIVSVLFQSHFFCIPAAARAGIPIIASEHNSPKSYKEHWWMSKDELDYLYFLLSFTHKIHILSPQYKEGYTKNLHSKMAVIGNSVDSLDHYQDFKNQKRENCIIAVGELSTWKNYEALIDAFSLITDQFPEWTLKIFGEGPEKETLLKKISQRPQLSSRVFLMGIIPHKELLKELLKAKICCHPSLAESFGFAVAEGLAAGLPAIGLSDTDGVNILIKNGYNGYLVSSNNVAEEMAVALRKLMSDDTLLEKYSDNAKESVKHISYKAIARKWNELIEWVFTPSTIRKSKNNSELRDKPLISFLTVCRKDHETILNSMRSIWNQNYDNIEHIVIGLNTNDDELIEEHLYKIDHIISKDDESMYNAINKGIKLASGDVICVVDSSYWLDSFAAERAVYTIINNQQDMVVGSNAVHDGNIINVNKAELFDVSTIWTGSFLTHNVVFASRKTYDSIGLYDASYNDLAYFKWFLDGSFNKCNIKYDNSIVVHSLDRGPLEIGENDKQNIKVLSKKYFDILEKEEIDFLFDLFDNVQVKAISNGDIEKLVYLIRGNIQNADFVYSVIKSMVLKANTEVLHHTINTIFEGKAIKKSPETRKVNIYTIKEFLKYKLRGTFLFKPAKFVYLLIKKLYKIS